MITAFISWKNGNYVPFILLRLLSFSVVATVSKLKHSGNCLTLNAFPTATMGLNPQPQDYETTTQTNKLQLKAENAQETIILKCKLQFGDYLKTSTGCIMTHTVVTTSTLGTISVTHWRYTLSALLITVVRDHNLLLLSPSSTHSSNGTRMF